VNDLHLPAKAHQYYIAIWQIRCEVAPVWWILKPPTHFDSLNSFRKNGANPDVLVRGLEGGFRRQPVSNTIIIKE
jgi:hypothetical protein